MALNQKEEELAAAIARAAANRAKGKAAAASSSSTNAGLQSLAAKQSTNMSRLSNKYSDVDELNVGKLTSLPWKDSELSKVHIYRVERATSAKCLALGSQLLSMFETGNITTATADICLTLAVSLSKPATDHFEWLLDPIKHDTGNSVPFTQPETADIVRGLSALEASMMQRARDKLSSASDDAERAKYQTVIRNLEAKEAGASTEKMPVVNESDASAYCFLAAFIMKLNGKAEESFIESLNMMKMRYAAWYEGDPNLLKNFSPTIESLRALRVIFTRRPELLSTWILTVAENENKPLPLTTTQQGLLNYLACQQYSYFGMHAYTLILSIHEATGLKLGSLLREMDCPVTRSGVMAAFDIIKEHEITSKNPNRKTYFRYARVWNSKYFSALQSSNCTTLVYVAAKVAKMTSAQRTGGDPMEIYAIKNMDEVVRTRLDEVAMKMASMVLDTMLVDSESGNAWKRG
nr:TPA_asm: N [Morinda alphacytorhabdovirus 1_Mor]